MRLPAGFILMSLILAVAGERATADEPGRPVGSCWRPEALQATDAERTTRRGGPGARLPAPNGPVVTAEPVPATLRGSIRRVALPPGQKLIALTFDLCEGNGEVTGYDGWIVDFLRSNGIRATFFSGGKWLENHPERAGQLIADPLFELGNHTWSHRNLRRLSGKRLIDEILRAEAAYERAEAKLGLGQCVGIAPPAVKHATKRLELFRFPYGACSPAALQAVGDAGLLAIQWDVVTGDPAPGQSAQRIARTVLRRARPGSIIVAHANGKGRHTAEALSIFIPKLQASGYRFVTVSELLAAGTPVIAQSCYETTPGDNDRY